MKKFVLPLIAALVCASQLSAQDSTSKADNKYQAKVQPAPQWPDATHATKRDGVFVSRQNVALLRIGMTKQQIYPLLDVPNFNEGFFGHHWNYLLNFETGTSGEIKQCQLQLHFNRHAEMDDILWREKSCAELASNHKKA